MIQKEYIAVFVPLFLAMIAVEYFIGRRRGLALYSREQTIASIVIGIGQRIIRSLPIGLAAILLPFAYEHRLFDLPVNALWYIPALFLGVEFFYYWMHRASHEIRWLWATHAVHHSTEEMNIVASSRLGWTGAISSAALIYLPLCMIGFPPLHVVTMQGLNLAYQAMLHTTLIRKLGPFEGVLNTPSAHRVHHARNADYLDRNHGGVLMIFDRIFGTYVEERDDEPVEFGLVTPPPTTNPIKIVFYEWGNIINDLKRYSLRHWPMLLFGPPGWAPGGQGRTSAELRAAYRSTSPRQPACPAE